MGGPTPSDADARDSDFAALYRGVAPALQVWAAVRIRPQLRGFCEVEDLLQEVWCRAYAIRDRFAEAGVEFRPWLFRVAKNVLFEVSRKARLQGQIRPAEGQTAELFQLDAVPDQVTSITRRVARDERLRVIQEFIEELPEDEQVLVLHIGLEGLDYADVATRLGLKHETVKKRWNRLRARLTAQGAPEALLEE